MSDSIAVPVIDLVQMGNPCGRKHVLDTVLHAVRDFGLFYIVNPAITIEMIEEAHQQSQAFFHLPMADKKKLDLPNCPSFLGYATVSPWLIPLDVPQALCSLMLLRSLVLKPLPTKPIGASI